MPSSHSEGPEAVEFAQETRQEVTKSPRGMRTHQSDKEIEKTLSETLRSSEGISGTTQASSSESLSPARDQGYRTAGPKLRVHSDFSKVRSDQQSQESENFGKSPPSLQAKSSFSSAIAGGSPALSADKIVELLVAEIGQTNYDLWFGAGCDFDVSGSTVSVRATSNFALTRLQSTFGRSIRQVIDRLGHTGIEIRYETIEPDQKWIPVPETQPASESDSTTHSSPGASGEKKKRQGKRQYRLSTFWFGENNVLAKASVDQLLKDLGQFSPLFFYGPCGSGKTHLLSAVTSEARRRTAGGKCVYLSAEQFTSLFLQSLRGSGLPMFRRKYRDLDLLAVDDVQFFAGKKATLNEFQYTIDNLLQAGKQVMISADRPPAELGELGPDITTRLTAGLVAPLNFPGVEGRMFIARQMCQERDFRIRDEVLEFVCRQVKNDVRQLSGVVNRIQLAQVAHGSLVSVEVAKSLMEDLISEVSLGVSMRQIEKVVCETCGVNSQDLKSSSRKKRICTARMLAMFLAREHTTSALSEIGDYFGRSHSTVIAAQKNVSSWLEENSEIALPNAAYRAKDVVRRIQNELRVG